MVEAFVLIQTEVGRAEVVAKQLAGLTGVLSSEYVTGPYDVVVRVGAPTLAELKSSVVPGVQSIYVKTYGCSHNHSDSEYMCGLLAQYGYSLVGEAQRQDADLWLINTCTVKNPSQAPPPPHLHHAQKLTKQQF